MGWIVLASAGSWVVGLAAYALLAGGPGVLWRVMDVVLLGGVLSVGLCVLLLGSARQHGRSISPVANEHQGSIGSGDWLGRVMIVLAVMGMLYTHWARPRLLAEPVLSGLAQQGVPDLLVVVIATIGIAQVALVRSRLGWVVRLRRARSRIERETGL